MTIPAAPSTWFTAPAGINVDPALHNAWLAAIHNRQLDSPLSLPGSGATVGAPVLIHNNGNPWLGLVESSVNALYPFGGAVRPLPGARGYPLTAWGARADGIMPGDPSGYVATDNRAALTAASTFVATVLDGPLWIPGAARPYDVKGPSPAYSDCVWNGDGPTRSVLRNTAETKGTEEEPGDFWQGSIVYGGTGFAVVGEAGAQSPYETVYGTCDAMAEGQSKLTNVSGITLEAGNLVLLASEARRLKSDGVTVVTITRGGVTREMAKIGMLARVTCVVGSTAILDRAIERTLEGGGRIHLVESNGLTTTPVQTALNSQWLGKPVYVCCNSEFNDIAFTVLDWLGDQRNQTFHASMDRCQFHNCHFYGVQNAVGMNPGGNNIFERCRFFAQLNAFEGAYATTRNRLIECEGTLRRGGMDYEATNADTYNAKTGSEHGGARNGIIGGVWTFENDELGKPDDLAGTLNLQGYEDYVVDATVYAGDAKGVAIGFADGGAVRNCSIHGGGDVGVASRRRPLLATGNKFYGTRTRGAIGATEGIITGNDFNAGGAAPDISHRVDIEDFNALDDGRLIVANNLNEHFAERKVIGRSFPNPVTSTAAEELATLSGLLDTAMTREAMLVARLNVQPAAGGTKSFSLGLNGTYGGTVSTTGSGAFSIEWRVLALDASLKRLMISADGMDLPNPMTFTASNLSGANTWTIRASTDGGNITVRYASLELFNVPVMYRET